MISVSGDAISPWNLPFSRTVPVKVYLPSIWEPSSTNAVSFLRVDAGARRLQGHIGGGLGGEGGTPVWASGCLASEHPGLLATSRVVKSSPEGSNRPATGNGPATILNR